MELLCDPVVEERYGRQVAAFKNAAGEPVCDIAVIPYQCIPILVHLDPAAVNKTVPWPSVREAHPLLSEMDRLRYHHWDYEPYRDFCQRLGLDPDRNRPTFDPSITAVGETLVLRACLIHQEQREAPWTFFGSSKTSLLSQARRPPACRGRSVPCRLRAHPIDPGRDQRRPGERSGSSPHHAGDGRGRTARSRAGA